MLVLPPPLLLHSLLKVMAGRIRDGGPLAVTGDVKYNGHNLNEFEVVRTSAYVGQVSRSCSAPAGAHAHFGGAALLTDLQVSEQVRASVLGRPSHALCKLLNFSVGKPSPRYADSPSLAQLDNHIAALSVYDTLEFAHTCQVGYKSENYNLISNIQDAVIKAGYNEYQSQRLTSGEQPCKRKGLR